MGKTIERPAILDQNLAREIKGLANPIDDGFETVTGKTLATDDFYEGLNTSNNVKIDPN